MQQDPFGNLADYGAVLDIVVELSDGNALSEHQFGLIRILKYKGNWRLREAVLNSVGKIRTPSNELIHQILAILDDDNIYYDVRILAGNALIQLFKNIKGDGGDDLHKRARKVLIKLRSTPQPPFFDKTLNRLCPEVGLPIIKES